MTVGLVNVIVPDAAAIVPVELTVMVLSCSVAPPVPLNSAIARSVEDPGPDIEPA